MAHRKISKYNYAPFKFKNDSKYKKTQILHYNNIFRNISLNLMHATDKFNDVFFSRHMILHPGYSIKGIGT